MDRWSTSLDSRSLPFLGPWWTTKRGTWLYSQTRICPSWYDVHLADNRTMHHSAMASVLRSRMPNWSERFQCCSAVQHCLWTYDGIADPPKWVCRFASMAGRGWCVRPNGRLRVAVQFWVDSPGAEKRGRRTSCSIRKRRCRCKNFAAKSETNWLSLRCKYDSPKPLIFVLGGNSKREWWYRWWPFPTSPWFLWWCYPPRSAKFHFQIVIRANPACQYWPISPATTTKKYVSTAITVPISFSLLQMYKSSVTYHRSLCCRRAKSLICCFNWTKILWNESNGLNEACIMYSPTFP